MVKGRDEETSDLILENQSRGNIKVYDIELTDKNRKQVIADIINRATGTYRDEIKYYFQVPDSIRGSAHRDGGYTYDQFINCSLDELENISWSRPSPVHSITDNKQYHG